MKLFNAAVCGVMVTSVSGTGAGLSMSNVGSLTAEELNLLSTLDPAQKKEARSLLLEKKHKVHHNHKDKVHKAKKHHHHRKHDQEVSMLQSGTTSGAGSTTSASAAVLKRREHALVRDKNVEHNVMSDFMKRFSRNMRAAVLEDSKGDLPEETRLKMIEEIKNENYRVDHGLKSSFKNVDEERKALDVAGAVDGKRHDVDEAAPGPAAPEQAEPVIQHTKPKHKKFRMLNAPIQPDDSAPAADGAAPAAPADGAPVQLLNTGAQAQASGGDEQQQDVTESQDSSSDEEQVQPPPELNLSQAQYDRLMTKCTDAKCEKRLKMLRTRTADREARGQIPAEADAAGDSESGSSSSDESQAQGAEGADEQEQPEPAREQA